MIFKLLVFAFILMMTTTAFSQQAPPLETGVSQILAKWRAANYSDVRYKLILTLEKMSPVLKGTIEISVKNNADQIILDWRKIRGKEDSSTVSSISVNGKPAKCEEASEHLIFKDGVIKGENVIRLDFTSPIATSGAAVTRYVDKQDGGEYIYSLFVPSDASTAFPVFDQPDLKARFSLTVKTFWGWKVISNTPPTIIQTLPTSHSQDSKNQLSETSFDATPPISTYVFAFAVGDFAEFEDTKKETVSEETLEDIKKNNGISTRIYSGIPKIYVRKSQAEKFKQHADEVFRLNREGVKFLESYFDYKFPFPKYDLVLIPEFPFGGMEHAGETFLREDSIIFPTEPTKNNYISRANVIFHEAAHQWFGDTVTMKWFDDLWLKEGFAEFMAYKTMEKVMPEYNAWKAFYERNKQAAYLTDSTKGTTPIYQEIPNLSAAKSAYGNIVYRKAPSFLRQAEFYLGEDKFQIAVRAFLKKHEFANAEWTDLVKEFEIASGQDLKEWASVWVTKRGMPIITYDFPKKTIVGDFGPVKYSYSSEILSQDTLHEKTKWKQKTVALIIQKDSAQITKDLKLCNSKIYKSTEQTCEYLNLQNEPVFIFPNYRDYGYGIFLLDDKSRDYVLKNIQNEKDDFLRTMMWGSLWDSVRETELAPKDYVELVVENINAETDESTIQTLLGRVSTAMNYYLSDRQRAELTPQVEAVLIDKMQNAPTLGQRITFYRAFLGIAASDKAKLVLKQILSEDFGEGGGNTKMRPGLIIDKSGKRIFAASPAIPLKTKDRFDIITRLAILGDASAPQLLAEIKENETSDEAKRYAYAVGAGFGTKEAKKKYFDDFLNDKNISESYIESAFGPFNSVRHSALTLPYLDKALAELPNLKRNRKIFFVNGWLGAFIGGQESGQALEIVNKFLADNPNLDKDLRLKILENSDGLERAVKIRAKYGN